MQRVERLIKTGNAHLRRVLVESAWTYQHRPNVQGRVLRRAKKRWRSAMKPNESRGKRNSGCIQRSSQPSGRLRGKAWRERSIDCARQGTSRLYVGHRRTNRKPQLKQTEGGLRLCYSGTTAVLITAEGIRKGEPSRRIVRYGFRTQPRVISPRQLPTDHAAMRFRPAYISVINRRATSFPVVIGTAAVRKTAPGSPAGTCFPCAAHRKSCQVPEQVLAGKGSLRRAKQRCALAGSAPFRPS